MRKFILGLCVILSIFLVDYIAHGFEILIINHELRLTKDDGGDYMITSVPQELWDSEDFNTLERMGLANVIFICRKDGKWDPKPIIISRYLYTHPSTEKAVKRLQLFMDICDKVVPNEEILAICYYADYSELIIYLEREFLKSKTHHEEVVRKLNKAL